MSLNRNAPNMDGKFGTWPRNWPLVPDPTIKTRIARLKASNAKKGLVQVQVWIPEDKRQDLHKLARKWRKLDK